MSRPTPAVCLFVSLGFSMLTPSGRAEVKASALFGNHMVLQQEAKLPVWGTADPGERVSVTLGKNEGHVTADAQGKWRVDLPPLPAGSLVEKMSIQGNNTIEFQDVLVGDVWVASGQSNMEFGMQMVHNAKDELPKANQPQIRIFFVPKAADIQPVTQIGAAPSDHELQGKWQVCTPETLAQDGNGNGFSGVAYFFAREMQHATGHAIGVIGSYWGGTPAQSWTSLAGFKKEPELKHFADDVEKERANKNSPYPFKWAEYVAAKKQWDEEAGKNFAEEMKTWQENAKIAKQSGLPEPSPKPTPSRPAPRDPGYPNTPIPSTLFNGMIAPLIPYAIKGVIWYQGESNANRPLDYRTLFPRLISDWREQWGEGDFPFLFVQLANYGGAKPEESWPLLREAQLKTLALPKTGMAVTIDIGAPNDIHPKDKLDVGLRLALAAKHVALNQNVVFSGPIYQSSKIEGNKLRLDFQNKGGGLAIGAPPKTFSESPAVPASELTGFKIAGADRRWVDAKARIERNTVLVTSAEVKAPAAARYAWANNPACNLYNQEGLPASPFRTDDWPRAIEPDGSGVATRAANYKYCADRVAAMKGKPCDLIFIGDSITQGWDQPGKAVWEKYYGQRNALNFGVSADTTAHVLWRLDNMEVHDFHPKAAVILIGTNNTEDPPADIAAGVKAVIDRTRALYPGVKVIVTSIMPNARATQKMAEANKIIRTFGDNRSIFYLDLAAKMTPAGDNWKGLSGDRLHPNGEGYELWAAEMEPLLTRLLGR